MEIQKKKEVFGENWKQVERQKLQSELEAEIGSEGTPTLYDSKDLYDFFAPITFYKDKDYKRLNMDYQQFVKIEEEYKSALKEADKNLQKLNESIYGDDGTSPADQVPLADNLTAEEIAPRTSNPEELEKLEKKKKARLAKDKVEEIEGEKLPVSAIGRAKALMMYKVSTYFSRFVPIYDKHVCTCCGVPKPVGSYYPTYDLSCSNRIDVGGTFHMAICKDCANKLFAYCYTDLAEKKPDKAMQYTCSYLNMYWDMSLYVLAKKDFEASGRKGTLLGAYIKKVNSQAPGKVFLDSPFLDEAQQTTVAVTQVANTFSDDAPYDWSREDVRNKSQVLKMVGYDPFAYETDENKRILYRDLLNILDEGMQSDLVKFQAGIQIVLSFFKLRQMNEKEYKMNLEGAPISELKALSDLKAKELTAITNFSRDNGFSERYATAKAKGENTFTGIMAKMNEAKYEKAILNRYDIETSATIQQAADASFKAIFNQLGMGESDVWKITQEQFEELTKLRKENSKLQEEVRKAKYREAELNLLEKEREMRVKQGLADE